jgi:hypothetical protein
MHAYGRAPLEYSQCLQRLMTKSAPSHTRGKLNHFVSKSRQNHSIFEQLGRILKQNRAKLRMPGFQRPQCPADNPPSLLGQALRPGRGTSVPPRETHALTELENAAECPPNANQMLRKCNHLLTPHCAGAHVISFGIIYLPARAITSLKKAEKRQQMLARARIQDGLNL